MTVFRSAAQAVRTPMSVNRAKTTRAGRTPARRAASRSEPTAETTRPAAGKRRAPADAAENRRPNAASTTSPGGEEPQAPRERGEDRQTNRDEHDLAGALGRAEPLELCGPVDGAAVAGEG